MQKRLVRNQNKGSPIPYRPWLHRFAVLFVIFAFGVITLGGTVTSKNVGLSVPDYPNTFGFPMLAVPFDLWFGRGGIFWEHSHRLVAMGIGILAIVMMFWLLHTQRDREWLRWLGVAALIGVIIEGLMGGLRVTELDVRFAMAHGIFAQIILCATVLIAAATSRLWLTSRHAQRSPVAWAVPTEKLLNSVGKAHPTADAVNRTPMNLGDSAPQPTFPFERGRIRGRALGVPRLRPLLYIMLGVLFVQLVLGASVRHTRSALAIPDFPTSYGSLVPPLSNASIHSAINELPYEQDNTYYSVAQVSVHYAHRVWAVLVLGLTLFVVIRSLRYHGRQRGIKRPAVALLVLLPIQLLLGAMVVWTQRHAEVATAHQAIGAAILATATLLAIRVELVCPQSNKHVARWQWPELTPTALEGTGV